MLKHGRSYIVITGRPVFKVRRTETRRPGHHPARPQRAAAITAALPPPARPHELQLPARPARRLHSRLRAIGGSGANGGRAPCPGAAPQRGGGGGALKKWGRVRRGLGSGTKRHKNGPKQPQIAPNAGSCGLGQEGLVAIALAAAYVRFKAFRSYSEAPEAGIGKQ